MGAVGFRGVIHVIRFVVGLAALQFPTVVLLTSFDNFSLDHLGQLGKTKSYKPIQVNLYITMLKAYPPEVKSGLL